MSATQKQIDANRQNAQHSTGPVTEEGKQAVSQNRTSHGLAGEFRTANEVEKEEFQRIFSDLVADYDVTCKTELELAMKMAESLVRSNRALLFQDSCFSLIDSGDDELAAKARKELELYMRYQAHHDRAFQRYSAELRKLQSERKKAEIGFESQQRKQAHENRKQERHQCTITLQKAGLEQQLIKNRKLAAALSVPEKNEKDLAVELAA